MANGITEQGVFRNQLIPREIEKKVGQSIPSIPRSVRPHSTPFCGRGSMGVGREWRIVDLGISKDDFVVRPDLQIPM